jgi:outer membrane protein TolC
METDSKMISARKHIEQRSSIRRIILIAQLLILTLVAVGEPSDGISNRRLVDSLSTQFMSEAVAFDSNASLDDYLAYAAIESPALRRAFYQWKAALEKSGYAGSLADPIFSYKYFIENVETRVGPQNQRLSLKQSFPWFGTLGAKKDIALQQANAAWRRFQSEKLKLFYSVKSAYYNYYYLGRDIALTKDNLELLKFWESVVRTRYKVALRRHPDVIKAQVELGKLEDRLLTLQHKAGPMAALLRAIMNLPDSVDIPIPGAIAVSEVDVDSDSIVAAALANNPDLKAMLHIVEKKRAGVRLAGKASLPNFTVGVDYIETGSALNPALPESGKDPWIVGVGVSLPIWFGKNSARKHEAEANLRASQYDYSDAQNRLRVFVEELTFEYSDALRKTRLYRDGLVPKAEQALNAGYTAYQTGEADFLSLLDAQRQLLAFQLDFEKSLSNLATRRAEIEMIIGKEIERQNNNH